MISVREYATLHATLFATYDRATTDPQLEIWYEALKDLDLDALKAAVALDYGIRKRVSDASRIEALGSRIATGPFAGI